MLTPDQKNFIYNCIDTVYLLNFEEDKNILSNVIKQLDKIGLMGKLEIVYGNDKHYAQTYTRALATALDKSFKNVFILENNFSFIDEKLESFYGVIVELEKLHWDVCGLGLPVKHNVKDFNNNYLCEVNGFDNSFAILYNYSILESLCSILPKYYDNEDVWIKWNNENVNYHTWLSRVIYDNFCLPLNSKEPLIKYE